MSSVGKTASSQVALRGDWRELVLTFNRSEIRLSNSDGIVKPSSIRISAPCVKPATLYKPVSLGERRISRSNFCSPASIFSTRGYWQLLRFPAGPRVFSATLLSQLTTVSGLQEAEG